MSNIPNSEENPLEGLVYAVIDVLKMEFDTQRRSGLRSGLDTVWDNYIRWKEKSSPKQEIKDTEESSVERKAFEAAREVKWQAYPPNYYTYSTFEDYKKQKGTANDVLNSEALRNVEREPDYSKPKPNSGGKDWEIVAYKGSQGKIWDKDTTVNDGYKHNFQNPKYWLEEKKSWESFTIHSVKRLSDGEVFSVGERNIGTDNEVVGWEIGELIIDGRDLMVSFKEHTSRYNIIILRKLRPRAQDPRTYAPAAVAKEMSKFKPQQESKRIEVSSVSMQNKGFLGLMDNKGAGMLYQFGVYGSEVIPKEKFPAIKSAIEKILNNEA